jgi:IclR family acetate operon transcriptional repressor
VLRFQRQPTGSQSAVISLTRAPPIDVALGDAEKRHGSDSIFRKHFFYFRFIVCCMKTSQAIYLSPLAIDHENAKDQPFDRSLAVLDAVTSTFRPISVTEIASLCDLPVPTAHRLVAQLEKRGLLKRALGSKKYLVGPGLLQLGAAAIASALHGDIPHRTLAAFANEIGEHCQIAMRAENALLYIDTVRALRSTGLHFEQGAHSPLHCTSIGKLFLAELDDAGLETWLMHAPLDRFAPRTIVRAADFRAEIRAVKKSGWAMNNEELAAGVVGCAVPIRDFEGRLLAGLGISVPSARLSIDQLNRFRPAMEAAAAAIAAAALSEN